MTAGQTIRFVLVLVLMAAAAPAHAAPGRSTSQQMVSATP